MPWTYTDEYYREYTRTTWNESAPAYARFMQNLAPFRVDLLKGLAAQPGEQVLDMGTGPGEPALSIGRSVGPQGRVHGIDLSEGMIGLARKEADAEGVTNVEFSVMDCTALTFPADSFDATVSAFGFQIFTDPDKAAAEALRVLRPGGRIAVAVWSTADRVPALHVLVEPMLKHAEPDETGYLPTPYETGGPGEMVAFLEKVGFHRATEATVRHTMHFTSEDDYLQSLLKATPIGHSLSEEEPAVQTEVLAETRANLRKWRDANGITVPAEAVIVTAVKPT